MLRNAFAACLLACAAPVAFSGAAAAQTVAGAPAQRAFSVEPHPPLAMIVTRAGNVRAAPGLGAPVLGWLEAGAHVTVRGRVRGRSWTEIAWKGRKAYVGALGLELAPGAAAAPAADRPLRPAAPPAVPASAGAPPAPAAATPAVTPEDRPAKMVIDVIPTPRPARQAAARPARPAPARAPEPPMALPPLPLPPDIVFAPMAPATAAAPPADAPSVADEAVVNSLLNRLTVLRPGALQGALPADTDGTDGTAGANGDTAAPVAHAAAPPSRVSAPIRPAGLAANALAPDPLVPGDDVLVSAPKEPAFP